MRAALSGAKEPPRGIFVPDCPTSRLFDRERPLSNPESRIFWNFFYYAYPFCPSHWFFLPILYLFWRSAGEKDCFFGRLLRVSLFTYSCFAQNKLRASCAECLWRVKSKGGPIAAHGRRQHHHFAQAPIQPCKLAMNNMRIKLPTWWLCCSFY